MRNLFLFTLLFSVLGCSKKETSEEEVKPYIISEKERENKKKDFPIPPIPPFYGTNNFIIDKEGNIFYFQFREVGSFCGFGLENDTIPYFIDLQPEDLIKIPNSSISDFVESNLRKGSRNFTHISSQSDTIKSENALKLLKAIGKYFYVGDKDIYIIRRTRQEEDTVLHYKKENKYYSSEDIKWDKSRIKFTETQNEI